MVWVFVLLGIIVFVNLLFLVPLKITGRYDEEFTMTVKCLWFELFSIPKKELTEEQKAKKKEKEKKQAEKEEKKRLKKLQKMGEDIDEATREKTKKGGTLKKIQTVWIIVRDTVVALVKHSKLLILKKFDLKIRVTGDDAADAAIKYGEICAFVYPALGIVFDRLTVNRSNFKTDISADYVGQDDEVFCDFEVDIKLLAIGFIVFVHILGDLIKR